ncbi:hypothetical protein HYH03_005191 [Edaphochlamys debaryana]|uniref:Uncharacterized protein n=1 Tax=Edaphochlamys debaryana TaxID=47281 RepID=A0A836C2K7_9CHLO|nr:hypothetical protein HYH03_005191 [Edaphochlamys debaryana]|eukprot:KAG2496783.1 hypothetical protein HYH03_005191 [Edaphochlamys debaryana]
MAASVKGRRPQLLAKLAWPCVLLCLATIAEASGQVSQAVAGGLGKRSAVADPLPSSDGDAAARAVSARLLQAADDAGPALARQLTCTIVWSASKPYMGVTPILRARFTVDVECKTWNRCRTKGFSGRLTKRNLPSSNDPVVTGLELRKGYGLGTSRRWGLDETGIYLVTGDGKFYQIFYDQGFYMFVSDDTEPPVTYEANKPRGDECEWIIDWPVAPPPRNPRRPAKPSRAKSPSPPPPKQTQVSSPPPPKRSPPPKPRSPPPPVKRSPPPPVKRSPPPPLKRSPPPPVVRSPPPPVKRSPPPPVVRSPPPPVKRSPPPPSTTKRSPPPPARRSPPPTIRSGTQEAPPTDPRRGRR